MGAMSFVNVTDDWLVADCPALMDTAAAVRISAIEAGRVNRMTFPSTSNFDLRTSNSSGRTRGRVPLRSIGQFLERVINNPRLRQVLGIIDDLRVSDPLTSIG